MANDSSNTTQQAPATQADPNDLKTTVLGTVAGLSTLLSIFHVAVPQEVTGSIAALAMIGLGIYTNKSSRNK